MKRKEIIRFMRIMSKGGSRLGKQLDKAKKPYIYVGMVCVREPYQGQGIVIGGFLNFAAGLPIFLSFKKGIIYGVK